MLIKRIQNSRNIFKTGKNIISNPFQILNTSDGFTKDIYKLRCIEALKGDKSYELAILLDKKSGKYLDEFKGGLTQCNVNLPINSSILLHGHVPVNGVSLPVSVQDFILMNNSNVDKIVAFNIKGQQSFLQKEANFVRLDKEQIVKFKNGYINYLIENAGNTDNLYDLIKYCMNNKNSQMIKQEIAERLTELQFKSPELVDNFWRQNASKFNLEYFSDFSP